MINLWCARQMNVIIPPTPQPRPRPRVFHRSVCVPNWSLSGSLCVPKWSLTGTSLCVPKWLLSCVPKWPGSPLNGEPRSYLEFPNHPIVITFFIFPYFPMTAAWNGPYRAVSPQERDRHRQSHGWRPGFLCRRDGENQCKTWDEYQCGGKTPTNNPLMVHTTYCTDIMIYCILLYLWWFGGWFMIHDCVLPTLY